MRKTIQIFASASAAALALSASAAHADCTTANNLLVNCGFESGDFTGWSLSGNNVPGQEGNLYGVEGIDPFNNIAPNSGSFQAFIGDLVSNSTTLAQTFSTTATATYLISFYLAQDTPPSTGEGANRVTVSFAGATVGTLNNVGVEDYTMYSFMATTNSLDTTFSITLGNGLGYFELDDVSVTQVPEPASLGLVGIALAGALAASRRRKA